MDEEPKSSNQMTTKHYTRLALGHMVLRNRNRLGMKQAELAKAMSKLGLQISPTYVSQIERQGKIPGPTLLMGLATVIGESPIALIQLAIQAKVATYSLSLQEYYKQGLESYQKKKCQNE